MITIHLVNEMTKCKKREEDIEREDEDKIVDTLTIGTAGTIVAGGP